ETCAAKIGADRRRAQLASVKGRRYTLVAGEQNSAPSRVVREFVPEDPIFTSFFIAPRPIPAERAGSAAYKKTPLWPARMASRSWISPSFGQTDAINRESPLFG